MSHFKHAELARIDGAGHWLQHDRPDEVLDVLRDGTKRANAVAEETLWLAKQAMKQDYFRRKLTVG